MISLQSAIKLAFRSLCGSQKGMTCDIQAHSLIQRAYRKRSVAICNGVEAKRLYLGIRECKELCEILSQHSQLPGVWEAIRNGEVVLCGLPVTMVCEENHLEALFI
jgi:hypothetical protein